MIENYKYSDKELDQLLSSMVILHDTREQVNEHILDYFDKKNVLHKRKALSYGDYSFYLPKNPELAIHRDLYFDSKVVIERKGSLEELSRNLTKDRDRIEKEFSLCPAKMILMIEGANYSDVINGNYRTEYNRKSFWASLHSFCWKYDLQLMFIPDKSYSGVYIRGALQYYLRNYLK